MRGYDSTSYGDAFADVYDEWYADVTDVDATVELICRLAGPAGRVLELGVGTGRLAAPLAAAGLVVTGVDSSAAMLAQLRARCTADGVEVTAVLGDMVDGLPGGPFDVVLVAYNTLFNLLDDGAQGACFEQVAARLATDGTFVVEAAVPDDESGPGADITLRSMAADRVVLSVSDHRPELGRTWGQFVELSEDGGVRLRPWSIRWSTPDELDEMGRQAGLTSTERVADMSGTPFHERSATHVTMYRRDPELR